MNFEVNGILFVIIYLSLEYYNYKDKFNHQY